MPKKDQKPWWKKLLTWADDSLLFVYSTLLLAFIPLYPKIPLFDILPGYIVRVRVEDMLIAIAGIIWLVQLARKKITWKSPLFKMIGSYVAVGFFSLLSAIFITQTVPLELLHIGKSALHFFRYIEYFFLFILIYASVNNLKQAKVVVWSLVITVFLVSLYGLGQKYWYWPVYSTMNREFSKGVRLYLTEHARVQSTFGGHYDLGAYLVIVLPILLSFSYLAEKNWERKVFFLVHLFGLWLLVASASRAPFAAYGLAAILVIAFVANREQTWLKKLGSFIKKSVSFGLLTGVMMLVFGQDMYERFLQVIEGYPQIASYYKEGKDVFDQVNGQYKKTRDQVYDWLGIIELGPPEGALGFDNSNELAPVLTATDQQPTTNKPSDVYVDVPDIVEISTLNDDGTTTITKIEKERTWSDNALKYGLSMGIRLDTLWPNAIKGFMRNPLLGSGYATLNKEGVYQFLEADSTDNNYLRILGETGLLGFLSFFGIIVLAIQQSWKYLKAQQTFIAAAAIGFVAGSIGLMANASYIDVYAASKVAFTYWGIVGLMLTIFAIPKNKKSFIKSKKK
ncbi:MAG: O-antigen ligase family protein [Candidatus Pacebacteria bacterium]|nr:O-antigen ligase family protein [Candidatus Paceibacterota bacterium]